MLCRAVSPLYALGARIHRALGRRRRAARGRPACAVVSVGGLTVGGAGKTPMAAWLARSLMRRGHRVVLASRGYGGRPQEAVTIVSDGVHVRAEVERAGDEAMVLASRATGVPVLVGADRLRVGHEAVTLFDAQILVLDDGFQHHRLARDFDLVCIDARAGIGNARVLPAGPLREPVAALRHADALCLLSSALEAPGDPPAKAREVSCEPPVEPRDVSGALPAEVRQALPSDRPVYRGWRRAIDLVPLGGGSLGDLAELRGARVGLVSGLARPSGFRSMVEALGAEVVRELRFPDHHAYRAEDLRPVATSVGDPDAPARWLTTEKDAYKILRDWVGAARVDVLGIGIELEDPTSLLDAVEARLRARGRLA
jgi:tetraacyldisaccharide 4'-kinase